MKTFYLSIALSLLASGIALSPSIAYAQDDARGEFERTWYDTCYIKKPIDAEKCYQQSKELIEKFLPSTYEKNARGFIKRHEEGKTLGKFQTALTAYSNAPDAAKLDQLFAAGDEGMNGDKLDPAQKQYILGRLALAGANGAMGEFYKNLDKVKGYAENALKVFEPAAPPEGWKKEEWEPQREFLQAQLNQYLGWHFIMGTKSDMQQGLNYLSKAVQIKCKECAGWRDANNYYMRSIAYSNQYAELRKPYDAMTDEQKLSDAGKEIRTKINELLDTKLIPEYARIVATATTPGTKGLQDFAKPEFDKLWEFRTDAKDKAADYIKNYAADPTIPSVPIPAKAEDTSNLNAPTAPATGPANVKLSTGSAPAAQGKGATANGNGKSTPARGKQPARGRKKRGG